MCNIPMAFRGFCAAKHGYGRVDVDDESFDLKDDWSYAEVGPTRNDNLCVVNGINFGQKMNCANDGTCGHPEAIRGMCAAVYGP
jgi:hypothetical protein